MSTSPAYPKAFQGLSHTNDGPTRGEERIPFATRLSYHGADGSTLEGRTTDVSLSGAFLELGRRPDELKVGQRGVVTVYVQRGDQEYQMAFACSIARITATGMGLFFDETEEHEGE